MYWRVISAIGMSRTSRFWRRIRYSSRSSGPSKASRNTSSACGGIYRSRGICVTGSPLTMAKGISPCSGSGGRGCAGGGLETTTLRSGFMVLILFRAQVHCPAHIIEGMPRRLARLLGALRQQILHQIGVVLVVLGALAHAGHFGHHLFDQRLLALQAADARTATARAGPVAHGLVGVNAVQVEYRAYVRIARIGASHARRIGLHGLELAHDAVRLLAQPDRVAIGLRHLATIEPWHLGRGGQQHAGLRQNADAGAFQVTEQALPVGHRNARIARDQIARA